MHKAGRFQQYFTRLNLDTDRHSSDYRNILIDNVCLSVEKGRIQNFFPCKIEKQDYGIRKLFDPDFKP